MAQVTIFRDQVKDLVLTDDSIVDATNPFSISSDNGDTWIKYETKVVLKAGNYKVKTKTDSTIILTQKV